MNKVWFSNKRVGFGLRPSSWEGWAALAGFAALLIASWRVLGPRQTGSWTGFIAAGAILLIGLSLLLYSRSARE